MPTVTFQGSPVHLIGHLPNKGATAPDFTLTTTELNDVHLKHFLDKKIILSIFPSLDTGVCATAVRKFNQEAAKINNVHILCISMDLPFAQKRFCAAEGIANVQTLSAFRHPDFGKDYGVTITEGKLAGLFSRAVVIIDTHGKVLYTEQVSEITHEPNYEAALAILSKSL